MDKLLEKLFDINKVPTKVIFVICLCCAIILFVPSEFLTKLNLADFLADYGKYIGITFIISFSLVIIAFSTYMLNIRSRGVRSRRFKKKVIQALTHLNTHEQALLREFFIQDKFAVQIPIHDDTMIGLLNKGIIYQASNVGPVDIRGAVFNYSITDFVREKLTNEILSLPRNPTDNERRYIVDARPLWAKEQERMNRSWRDSAW